MEEEFVMVTTSYRGVFAGYLPKGSKTDDVVTLTGVRNCVRWETSMHGVFGLAANGPSSGCRIGPQVPEVTIRSVTSVSVCTEKARQAWENEPWL